MIVEQVVCGPISVNSYVVFNHQDGDCLVVDPGDADAVERFLTANGLNCTDILLTHGHFDHILGAKGIQDRYRSRIHIHPEDAVMLSSSKDCFADYFGFHYEPVDDFDTIDKDNLTVIGLQIEVQHTPGHSPGSVIYTFKDENVAFCGDTIFYHGFGRYDLPGGSYRNISASIKRFLKEADPETTLYTGHGIPTTVKEEQRSNLIFSEVYY